MRLSFADLGVWAIDNAVEIDAACLFVFADERPLQGLAGYIDWRLCGALSRILLEGRFVGEFGDALLFPVRRNISFSRIFCFGAGQGSQITRKSFSVLARKACETLSLAGSQAFIAELPPAHLPHLEEEERAKIFLEEGVSRFSGQQILLVGDGKALIKSFQSVAPKATHLHIDREPWGANSVVSPVATSAVPYRKDRAPVIRHQS